MANFNEWYDKYKKNNGMETPGATSPAESSSATQYSKTGSGFDGWFNNYVSENKVTYDRKPVDTSTHKSVMTDAKIAASGTRTGYTGQRNKALQLANDWIESTYSYLTSGRHDASTRDALKRQYNGITNYLKTWGNDIDEKTLGEINKAIGNMNAYLDPSSAKQALRNGTINSDEYAQINASTPMLGRDFIDKTASANVLKDAYAKARQESLGQPSSTYTGYKNASDSLNARAALYTGAYQQAKKMYESGDPLFKTQPAEVQMAVFKKPEGGYNRDNYGDYWDRIEALAGQQSWTPELKEEAKEILEAFGGDVHTSKYGRELLNSFSNGEISRDEYNHRMSVITSLQNKYNSVGTALVGGVLQGAGGQSLGTALNNASPSDAWTQFQNDVGFSAAEKPLANQAGNMAGRIALMSLLGEALGPVGAVAGKAIGGTAGAVAGSAVSSGLTFGANSAIQNLGEATTTGEWGKYAGKVGIGTLAGAAGGAASAGSSIALSNALKNHLIDAGTGKVLSNAAAKELINSGAGDIIVKRGLQTPFMNYVKNVATSMAFTTTSTGVETAGDALIDGKKPEAKEVVNSLLTNFVFAMVSGVGSAIRENGFNAVQQKYAEIEAELDAYGRMTYGSDEEKAELLNTIRNRVNEIKVDVNSQYYAGSQVGVDDLNVRLDNVIGGIDAMLAELNVAPSAASSASGASAPVGMPMLTSGTAEPSRDRAAALLESRTPETAPAVSNAPETAPTISEAPKPTIQAPAKTAPTIAAPAETKPATQATKTTADRLPTTANTDTAILEKVSKNYVKADMPALAEAIKANVSENGPIMDYVDEMTEVYGAVQTQLKNGTTVDQKALLAMGRQNGGEINLTNTQILAAADAAINDHFKLVVNTNKTAGVLQKPAANATIQAEEINNVRTEEAGEPLTYSTEDQPGINQIGTGETVSEEWWQPVRAERTENPQWKVSSLKELSGISTGSSDKIDVVNTADIKGSNTLATITRQNSAAGISTYLYRGNVSRTAGGATVNANAFNVNGDVYIPADVSPERARVLAGHEYHEVLESRYPEFKATNRSEVARVAKMLPKDSSGETSYDKMLNTLRMAYKQDAPDLTEAQVEDEIIHDIYAGLDASEGLFEEWFGEQFTQDIKQIQSALKRSADTFVRAQQKAGKFAVRTDAGEVAAETHSPVGFSLELAPQIAETSVKGAEKYGKDVDEYKEVSDKVLDLANYMKKVTMDENGNVKTDVNGNPLIPDERFISNNIFSNASYLKDAEPTTECFRQLVYFSFQEKVSDILKRPLTEKEAIIANQAVAEIGIEAPCLYCYSLMDRKAKEAYKIRYVDERNAFMDLFDSEYNGNKEKFGKDRNKNFDRYLNLYMTRELDPSIEGTNTSRMPVNNDKKARVKLWMDEYQYLYHEPTDVATLSDVRNWDADQTLTAAYKSIPDAKIRSLKQAEIKDLQYWVQSASQAKKRVEYAAYSNVKRNGKDLSGILTWKQSTINALNNEYGLRWYSHAEYHPAFTVDNIQQIIDASIRGLKGLMYTKEIDAVRIVAPSGMNINVSCFAKLAPDGKNYISDDALGANWDEIKALREKFPNVGSVMVVTNDDMLFWAISQDWIDCVIPLHKVRSGDVFMKEFGLTNYTPYQEDKLTDKQLFEKFISDICAAKNITDEKQIKKVKSSSKVLLPKDHNNSYEQYAAELAKRGLTARFDNILQEILAGKEYDGVPITTDMYMKLVNETRMPMNQIEPLKPIFDYDAAKGAIDTLAEKGYYNYFKPSSQWTNRDGELVSMTADDWAQQAAADIKAGTPIAELGYGRDLAWDASKGKYIETAAEAKAAGIGGVHDNVGFSTNLSDDSIRNSLRQYAPTFYRKSQRVIEDSKQDKFSANSVVPMLKGKGIKDDEIKWSGIQEFLDGKKSVTKDELLSYMSDNQLEITEKVLSSDASEKIYVDEDDNRYTRSKFEADSRAWMIEQEYDSYKIHEHDDYIEADFYDEDGNIVDYVSLYLADNQGDTNWAQYKVQGGTNYREILFQMPDNDYINPAMNVHWKGEQGVLAHARVQDFNDYETKAPVMFIEEIQSDWHNAGQKTGYADAQKIKDAEYDSIMRYTTRRNAQRYRDGDPYIISAKAKLEENGYSDTGIEVVLTNLNTLETAKAFAKDTVPLTEEEISAIVKYAQQSENIENKINEAARISKMTPDAPFKTNYTDFVLKSLLRQAVEGGYDYLAWTTADMQSERWSDEYAEGYRIEYDQDIPKFLKKYGKQWGAQLKTVDIYDTETGELHPVPAIEINNAMRESVLYAGQSMFSIQLNPDSIKKAYLSYNDPQRWQADRVGDPDKKPMPLADIIAKIRHDYKINITTGHVRGAGVRGTYDLRNGGIRTKLVNNLPTISHELGHAIDHRAGLTENVPKDVLKELNQCLDDSQRLGQIGQYPAKERPAEGLAEYLRKYLQESAKTANAYPKLTDYIKKKLDAKDLALLENLADEINAYYALDADTATSSIKLRENKGADFRTIGEKIRDKSADWYQAWVDANHPFKQLDREIGSNTYLYATNAAYSDSVAGEIILGDLTDMNGQYVGPGLSTVLADINTHNKTEYNEFGEYLVMRHATEFMFGGEEGKPRRVFADDRKNTPAFFEKRAKELEAKYPAFQNAADGLYDFINNLAVNWGINTGIINADTYAELREKYKFYVPFNRVTEKGKSSALSAKRGFANQSSPIRRAKGSGLDIVHPVDSIISNIALYVNAGTRNNVMLELRKAAAKYGVDATFMEKVPTPMVPKSFSTATVKGKVADQVETLFNKGAITQETVDELTNTLNSIEDIMLQFSKGKAGGDVVTVLVDGQPEFWKINDPNLLTSVANLAPTKLSGVLEAYAKTTRFLTANITGNNPVWSIFSNAPRDLGTFIGYFKDKKKLPKALASIGIAYVNSFKENALNGKGVDPLYKEYLAMGGGQTSVYSADANIAKKARKKLTSTTLQRVVSMVNPLNVLSFLTDTIEQGPRFATYRVCRMGGMTPQEAFYEAMDITVNFRKAGTRSREINKVVPFFNASVQGIDKFARYFSASDVAPGKRAAAVRSRVGFYVAVSAALAGIFYAINNASDQRKKEYQQLSNYTKNSFWCIPIGDGKYFTVPKPREMTVLTSFFETLMEYGIGKNRHAFDEFYNYAVDNFFPSVASDIMEIPSNIAEKGIGDGLKESMIGALGSAGVIGIAANVAANRDFLGRSIESAAVKDLEAKQRYTETTSKMAYWLGQAFNLSPQIIDYIGNNALGYIWKVPKALFPVGSEHRDFSLGVASSYVKDNQYSNDIVNWMYDSATKTEMAAKSYPDDMDKAIAAKLDSTMKTFYGKFNGLNKNNRDLDSQRGNRQIVLDMIMGYRDQVDSGEVSEAQEKVYAVAKATNNMSLLPHVMETNVKDSEKVQYNLTDTQYLDFQSKYNELYWSYVEQNIDEVDSVLERATVLEIAHKNAKRDATTYMLRMLGGDLGITDEMSDVQAERNENWSNTTLMNAIKDTPTGADMDSKQSDLVAGWINKYLQGKDDTWMETADAENIPIETAMLYELALRKYDSGSPGSYDGIDKWNALNNMTELSKSERDKLWSVYGVSDTTFDNYKSSKKYKNTYNGRKEREANAVKEPEPETPVEEPVEEPATSNSDVEYTPVSSDVLAGYEYHNGVLTVTLNSGRVYSYNVSQETFDAFETADSKGKFWNYYIK